MCLRELEGYPSRITQRIPIRKRAAFLLPATNDRRLFIDQPVSAVDAK